MWKRREEKNEMSHVMSAFGVRDGNVRQICLDSDDDVTTHTHRTHTQSTSPPPIDCRKCKNTRFAPLEVEMIPVSVICDEVNHTRDHFHSWILVPAGPRQELAGARSCLFTAWGILRFWLSKLIKSSSPPRGRISRSAGVTKLPQQEK